MASHRSMANNQLLNIYNGNDIGQTPLKPAYLKRHYPAIWLVILYIPLVTVPWAITVVLSYHPLSKPTYYYPKGFDATEHKQMQDWVTAIQVLNSIASILALPVVSFVIAQTAVVFSQKRSPARQLSVRDIFAFADRAWLDISVLFKLMRAKGRGSRAFNSFITLASSLLFISALQPPLYQILVDWQSILIPSGKIRIEQTSPTSWINYYDRVSLGSDAEPAIMEMIPHATVVQNVQFQLRSIQTRATEPYMWIDFNKTDPSGVAAEDPDVRQGDGQNTWANIRQNDLPIFFAAYPFNTTTGSLRYHAMRFNSTVNCENVRRDKFPTVCSGDKPFATSFEVRNETTSTKVEICVPGKWGTSPWTLSRHRQDIAEEAYVKMAINGNSTTMHCSSTTTRGYFELGNYRINGAYGQLLEQWPSTDIIKNDFNDLGAYCMTNSTIQCEQRTYLPTERDPYISNAIGWTPDEPEYMRWNASGPLVTSIIALFGDNSWIRTASNLTSTEIDPTNGTTVTPIWWNPVCEGQPLYRDVFNRTDNAQCMSGRRPSEVVAHWLEQYLSSGDDLEYIVEKGVGLANKAILTIHKDIRAPRQLWNAGGRRISSSSGYSILKPNISLASTIIISVLITVQAFGLVFCVILVARTPTWTRVFNAMAIARIGAGLDKDKLPMDGQYAEDEDYEKLREVEVPLCMVSTNAIIRRATSR